MLKKSIRIKGTVKIKKKYLAPDVLNKAHPTILLLDNARLVIQSL